MPLLPQLCCLALSAINELIRASVIDLRATWRVLAPQLTRDRRPPVLVELCRLLALTAKVQVRRR